MTTRHSYKASQKIVLTEQQDKKFIAEEEKQRHLADQRNELAIQQAEPFVKILKAQIEGIENPKDEWENTNTIMDFQKNLIEESKRAVERLQHPSSHNLTWVTTNIENIKKLNQAIETSRDILQRTTREIVRKYREELDPFVMPDPIDFITENKREEILKALEQKKEVVI